MVLDIFFLWAPEPGFLFLHGTILDFFLRQDHVYIQVNKTKKLIYILEYSIFVVLVFSPMRLIRLHLAGITESLLLRYIHVEDGFSFLCYQCFSTSQSIIFSHVGTFFCFLELNLYIVLYQAEDTG